MDEILNSMQNIAVVGFSPDISKDSNKVGKYLIVQGFNVFPVYPQDGEIYGRKIYKSVLEIPENIDTIVMFRKGEFASKLIDDVIKKGAKNFWLQLGIRNDEAAKIAAKHGINFVQDACIMVEHTKISQK